MPYRDAPLAAPSLAPSAGIVDDLIRQFADPYAFLRELVQNGIDAGATQLTVSITSEARLTRTTVADNGSGMTRATIEGPLLTLFASSKEDDPAQIGKYGVGFISVFSTRPTTVEVATWRPGESWLLRLFGDQTYELEQVPPRPGSGTEVSLRHALDDAQQAVHDGRVAHALRRWCRHTRVPISLTTPSALPWTINTPLTVPGAIALTIEDGDTVIAVGAGAVPESGEPEAAESFAGFYNRGLTLVEAVDAVHAPRGIRFKADSPRLAHTLSRDDVRRDEEYEEILYRVSAIIDGPLQETLARELHLAAEAAATGPCDRLLALLHAALVPRVRNEEMAIVVPLVDPAPSQALADLYTLARQTEVTGEPALLFADASTPLTRALARAGRPVIRHTQLATVLGAFVNVPVLPAEQVCVLADASLPRWPDDLALTRELERLARAIGRELGAVRLATFVGDAASAPHALVPLRDSPYSLFVPRPGRRPWNRRAMLLLRAEDDLVRLARRRARTDVRIAAHLLFRGILLHEGPLDPRDVDRLLAAAAGQR